jgi:hypothetical protein
MVLRLRVEIHMAAAAVAAAVVVVDVVDDDDDAPEESALVGHLRMQTGQVQPYIHVLLMVRRAIVAHR